MAGAFLAGCPSPPDLIRNGSLAVEPASVYNNADSLLVHLELLAEADLHLELWSLDGKELWQGTDTPLKAGQHTLLPDKQLWSRSPGIYTLRAIARNAEGEDTEKCALAVLDSVGW